MTDGRIDSQSDLMKSINDLSIWRKGDQRAPHKPLLILYALAKYQNEGKKYISYELARKDLKQLLMEFVPLRKSYHPEQPFVRLTHDGIWKLNQTVERDNIKDNWLMAHDMEGGFTEDVLHMITENPGLIREIAETLLEQHFSETLHQDILSAVGLDLSEVQYVTRTVRKRDPQFRNRILSAYGYRCAVCGYDVRLQNQPIGLEAAHIKWHQVGGPDREENGLALCSLHHKLFDMGAFTLGQNQDIRVSRHANGSTGLQEWLLRFKGQRIQKPVEVIYQPEPGFIEWHVREVYKGDYLQSI